MNKVQNQIPESKVYLYECESSHGIYALKEHPLDSVKLPPQLKIEENQRKGNVKTKYIVRERWDKWSKTILTGLGLTKYENTFYGDQYTKKKKSFLIFQFLEGNRFLRIHHFNSFYPLFPALRERIIDQIIKKGNRNDSPSLVQNQLTD